MHSRDISLIWLSWTPWCWLQQQLELEQRLASCWWGFWCHSREDCCWDDGAALISSWGLDGEIGVRGIKRGTVPGTGVKLGELWWGPERPGQGRGWGTGTWADRRGQAFISKAQSPWLLASAKQLGRCPADLTPPQGRNCRAPVTRAAQIEVSSPESRCSPIFCMRWCRVGIQPVDKWLQFRLQFGCAKETVMCVCLCVFHDCVCVEHCRSSVSLSLNDAAMQHKVVLEKSF